MFNNHEKQLVKIRVYSSSPASRVAINFSFEPPLSKSYLISARSNEITSVRPGCFTVRCKCFGSERSAEICMSSGLSFHGSSTLRNWQSAPCFLKTIIGMVLPSLVGQCAVKSESLVSPISHSFSPVLSGKSQFASALSPANVWAWTLEMKG